MYLLFAASATAVKRSCKGANSVPETYSEFQSSSALSKGDSKGVATILSKGLASVVEHIDDDDDNVREWGDNGEPKSLPLSLRSPRRQRKAGS